MKRYLRLVALLTVLTLSVGMLSSAINILGDITRLDLDEPPDVILSGLAEAQGLNGGEEKTEVGFEQQNPRGPVVMIKFAPGTRYLRRYAAYNYSDGFWNKPTDIEPVEYNGSLIEHDPSWGSRYAQVQFQIHPMVNLTGLLLTTQDTDNIQFNGTLDYFEEIQSFEATDRYDDPYIVSYKQYMHSEAALHGSEGVGPVRALEVPPSLATDLRRLGGEITEGETTDYGKLVAIKDYLTENYEFNQTYTPAPSTIDPIRWFLFNERVGVGSHFNSAFIMLARSLGIPVRAVIGYIVDAQMEVQYVMPNQAYMWAEIEFNGLGWLTIDASPRNTLNQNMNITQDLTLTNITGNDPIAVRGRQFHVWGTVKTMNGSDVKTGQVEVMLKENKTDTEEVALIVGVGEVTEGLFNVTCDATPMIQVGGYNLIAHSLETPRYRESWSDPPIKVVAETIVELTGPRQVYQGRNITYRGTIIDASDGSSIANASMIVDYLDNELTLTSDTNGKVSFIALFPNDERTNLTLRAPQAEFLLASMDSIVVLVIAQPDPQNILGLLFSFPYNIGLALTASIGVGFYAARRNRRIQDELATEEPRARIQPRREYIGFEDGVPLEYTSYEEGIVKLFNRFYVSMQRIHPDIDDAMTPREFQYLLLDRMPMHADALLEDLVSSYEIAMYSNITLSQEDFKRTNATIELVIELMNNGSGD